MSKKLRINKALVELGYATSRRKADELVIQGLVSSNNQPIKNLATTIDLERDTVSVSGIIPAASAVATILVNKPVGYVCSHRAQGNDKSVFDLLPTEYQSLKIAGRLDKDSEGLVLLSSDGQLVNQLSHPSYNKQKTYEVWTDRKLAPSDARKLLDGVQLADGVSKFDKLKAIGKKIVIVMHEGRNRQIRRSLQACGYKVMRLRRTKLGNYTISNLEPGKWKKLDTIEP